VVFKRMLGAFGVGAPSVDTVLSTPRTRPGGTLEGEVRLKGGDFDAGIEHITLVLEALLEVEHGGGESTMVDEFARTQVSGPFTLAKGEDRVIAFTVPGAVGDADQRDRRAAVHRHGPGRAHRAGHRQGHGQGRPRPDRRRAAAVPAAGPGGPAGPRLPVQVRRPGERAPHRSPARAAVLPGARVLPAEPVPRGDERGRGHVRRHPGRADGGPGGRHAHRPLHR
jgi:hypothetical protein